MPQPQDNSRCIVSVLCVASKNNYAGLPDLELYDEARDAWSFRGDTPVIAHPPCRSWSAYCAHQAKPLPGERELALQCCEWLRSCGGVLEQPAHSRLFRAANLPLPGESLPDLKTIQVNQAWWGYPVKKATWLCFSKCSIPDLPYSLAGSRVNHKRRWQVMSKRQRSETCPELCEWLVAAARSCYELAV